MNEGQCVWLLYATMFATSFFVRKSGIRQQRAETSNARRLPMKSWMMTRFLTVLVVAALLLPLVQAVYKTVNVTEWLSAPANYSEEVYDDARNWCSYLQKVDEPPILLYNRLSKCGSTTMKLLFDKMAEDNDFVLWNAPKEYWKDLDLDQRLRKSFLSDLNGHKKKDKRLVADGHWYQTTFTTDELKGNRHENIQLLRECKSRRHSKFFYGLFDSSKSSVAKEKGERAFNKFKHEYINSDLSVEECLNNYACLSGSGKFDRNDTEIIFLCGTKCENMLVPPTTDKVSKQKHHKSGADINYGAFMNVHNPAIFTAMGALDYMSEYMEMLECAYPTFLNGIYETYVKEETHGMTGSHGDTYTPAMEKMLTEACNETSNGFVNMFEVVKETFLLRYKYFKHNDGCCRKRANV